MPLPLLPIAIGAGGAILGSYIGGRMQQDATRDSSHSNAVAADRNAAAQKEFAQQGIQWKVEDARKAGIHPLAALGASTTSFAPSYVGEAFTPSPVGNAVADGLSNLGQNVSRAAMASQTEEERAFNTLMQAETLKNASLKNKLLESQLSFANQPQNPAFPSPMDGGGIPGQGNLPVSIKKAQITASDPGRPAKEAGAINDYGFVRTDGGYAVVPSKDAKERTEDDFIQQVMWAIRNQALPLLTGKAPPDTRNYPIPENLRKQGYKYWHWHPLKQEFVPSKNK